MLIAWNSPIPKASPTSTQCWQIDFLSDAIVTLCVWAREQALAITKNSMIEAESVADTGNSRGGLQERYSSRGDRLGYMDVLVILGNSLLNGFSVKLIIHMATSTAHGFGALIVGIDMHDWNCLEGSLGGLEHLSSWLGY